MDDNRGRVIAFYSFKAGIGQSTTIATVAGLLTKWQRKVLLVDCDFSSDGLISYFGINSSHNAVASVTTGGLHSLLRTIAAGHAANWRDYIVRLGAEGSPLLVDVMPSGALPVDASQRRVPMERIASENSGAIAYMEALRRDWCAEYDVVLFDSKPPFSYPDAMWSFRFADAAIVMIPTQKEILQRARAVIDQAFDTFHADSSHRGTRIVPVTARYEDRVTALSANGWIPQLVSVFQKYYQVWAPGLAATSVAEKLKLPHQPEWNWKMPGMTELENAGPAYASLAKLIANDFNWRSIDQTPALLRSGVAGTSREQPEPEVEALNLYLESRTCRQAAQVTDAILLAGMALSRWRACTVVPATHNAMFEDVSTFLLGQLNAFFQTEYATTVPSESDRPYLAALGSVLSNLSTLLGRSNEIHSALEAQRGSVELRRHLAKQWCTDYEPELARSLHNYAKLLSAIGDRQNAIQVAAEAVAIRRRWSRQKPAQYALSLARSLVNLALRFDEAGERKKAMLAMREAVVILRRLVRVDVPDAEIDLARTLTHLASLLRTNGDNRHAASTMWEAVRLWMRIRKQNPKYAVDLALAFENFSLLLATANEGLLAITAAERAVLLLRKLSSKNPARFEPQLARSLNNLSTRLAAEGYSRRALGTIEEAVQIHSRLAESDPQRYSQDLAQSLNNLSNRVAVTGNWLKALDAIDKAVAIRSRLNAESAEKSQGLAISLYNKSLRLYEADEAGLALVSVENTLRNVRRLLVEAEQP